MDILDSDWFAGFFDGEGCFTLQPGGRGDNCISVRAHLCQRDDHRDVLDAIRSTFGGYIGLHAKPQKTVLAAWYATDKATILRLIDYFDNHQLYVKYREYVIWREAALFYYSHTRGAAGSTGNPAWLMKLMLEYKARLENTRRYKPDPNQAIQYLGGDANSPLPFFV